jgi:uncharacterized membrane protein YhaH (DUF805 family)
VVVSHWLLDLVTHVPDLPLWPGGPEVGLGLWNSVAGTLFVEGGLLVIALMLYTSRLRARDRAGHWWLWTLVGLTVSIWASQPWAPPAPGPTAVAATVLCLWILPFWGQAIERHRQTIRLNG